MSFSCFNTFQNAALFSKPVSFFFPVNKGPFTSLFVNGYLSSPNVPDNTITDKNSPIAGWNLINGTGTSYYVGSGTTSLYTGTPLPAVSNKYIISVNGDPSGGALPTGNVQTMTQTYQFPTAGTYNLVFYVFAGAVIDPLGTHSVSVYVGGQPVLYNYSVGNVPNSAPQVVTMPFSVDASNLTLTVGFVFYCANANRSYLGITGMTYFSQTTTPYSFLASDPSGIGMYLPLQSDYQNYAAGSSATSGTSVTMNGGGKVVLWADVSSSSTTATLGRGLGYMSLDASSQQYLAFSGNPITLPIWYNNSNMASGFTLAGWFYGLGASQKTNATLISLTGDNGLSMNLRYFQQNPLLIFTADPARVVCGVPTYNILPNTWNHVSMVIGGQGTDQGTAGSQVPYRFYLNGILLTTAYGPWPNGEYTAQTIGYDSVGNYFNGYIEDIRVYNRALTINDINVLATLPVNNTTNSSIVDIKSMVMYYSFQSGSFTNNYGALSMPSISITNPNFTIGLGSGFGWTVYGSGIVGTSAGYSYPLPTGITTYLTVKPPSTIGSSITVSQNITYFTSSIATPYVLTFYTFPCGNPGVTLTVSIGNLILLNRVSFGLNARTPDTTAYNFVDPTAYNIVDPAGIVMYYSMDFASTVYNTTYNFVDNTFTLPFLFTGVGTFPLGFTFTNESGASSILGITGVKIATINSGSGYTAVDISNLALYYPLDTISSNANYATGTAVMDSVLANGATVNTNVNGCLSLIAANNQYMSMGSWTPPKAALSAGMSFTGWFYAPVGITQVSNAVLFSLAGGRNGAQIQCVYNTIYGCLEFITNSTVSIVQDYTAWSCKLIPGSWYFLAYTISSTNNVGTGAIHTYYLNDSCMNQIINSAGTWVWPSGVFSTNTLGTSSVWNGSFGGYLDDFRVYNRTLSVKDVAALWTYGYNSITTFNGNYGNLLDPSGLQIYYPFNQGTGFVRMIPAVTVSTNYGTVFTNITTTGCTVNYGPNTTYYYVTTTRNILGVQEPPIVQSVGAITSNIAYTTGLTADVSYTFSIIPYDEIGTKDTNNTRSVTTIPFSPIPVVSFGSYTPGLTSITLNYSNVNTANRYVTIGQSVNGGGVGLAMTGSTKSTSYTYFGVSAYNYYSYNLTPYNSVDISGALVNVSDVISPIPDVSFTGFSDISFTRLSVMFASTYTATATSRSYYDISMARTINNLVTPDLSTYTIMPAISDTSYIDTTVMANNYYNYFIIPYNALYVSGTVVPTTYVSPVASVTFTGYTLTKTTIQLTYGSTITLYFVMVEQSMNGGASYEIAVSPGAGVFTYTYTGLTPSVAYQYRLTPYNAIATPGSGVVTTAATSPNADVSFLSFSGVTTTGLKMNYGSISGAYVSYSYVSTARSTNGVGAGAVLRATGDVSLVETALSPNTLYSYSLVPYNAINVAGTVATSWNIYTLPLISSVVPSISTSTNVSLTLPVDGSYSFYDVSRSDGGVGMSILQLKAPSSSGIYTDTSMIVTNTHYMYYVTPYTVSYVSNPAQGASYSAGATVSTGYLVQPVTNGYFTSPNISSGSVSALNPTVSGWSVAVKTVNVNVSIVPSYYVGDGSVAGYYVPGSGSGVSQAYYTGYMPNVTRTQSTQYMLLGQNTTTTSSTTVSQTITVPSAGIYYLTWYAFAGAYKDAGHSMSVYIGGVNSMYGILGGSATTNTVPQSYTIPWLASAGNLSVTVGFTSSSSSSSATSYIGLTGITCFSMATNSLGLTVIDPSALVVYCPLNTDVYDYAGGSLNTGRTTYVGGSSDPIVTVNAFGLGSIPVGIGCMSLNGILNYLILPTLDLINTDNISFAGWFYGLYESQDSNSTLFSFQNGNGSKILALYYNGTTSNMTIRISPTITYTTTTTIMPNTWNHFTIVGTYGGNIILYINGLVKLTGIFINTVNALNYYTNNMIGYSLGATSYTPGYFTGYISDVRVYTRALSNNDVLALWNFGNTNVSYSLVDTVGMVMYYAPNYGTKVVNSFVGKSIYSVVSGTRTATNAIDLTITGDYSWFNMNRVDKGTLSSLNYRGINNIPVSYLDTNNLIDGTKYTYILTPYDVNGIMGIPYTFNWYTIPTLFGCYVNNIINSQITVNFSGSYSYVNIQKYNDLGVLLNTITKITGVYYNDTNLQANTTYTYTIIPYNPTIPKQFGSSVTIVGKTTNGTPTITSVNLSDVSYNKITINFTGFFYKVNILRTGIVPSDSASFSDISMSPYIDITVNPNTRYSYQVVPYYTIGTNGASMTSVNVTTPSNLIVTIGKITMNSIQVLFSNPYSYSYIYAYLNGISYTNRIVGDVSYTYSVIPNTNTSLSPDTSYAILLNPYNSLDVPGTPFSQILYTIPAATITNISFPYVGYNRVDIGFNGDFYNVNILRTNNITLDSVSFYNISTTSYSDMNVSPNTSYSYKISSYSNTGIAGTAMTSYIMTLPNINVSLGKRTTTSIQVLFDNQYNYSYIYAYLNGIYAGTIVNDVSYTYSVIPNTNTSLSPNTSYAVLLKPFNNMNVSGTSYSNIIYTLPLPTLLYTPIVSNRTNNSFAIDVTFAGYPTKIELYVYTSAYSYKTFTYIPTTESGTTTIVAYNTLTNTQYFYVLRLYTTTKNVYIKTMETAEATVYTRPIKPSVSGSLTSVINSVAGSMYTIAISNGYKNKVYTSTDNYNFTTDNVIYYGTPFKLPNTSESTTYFYVMPYDNQNMSYDDNVNASLTYTFTVSNRTLISYFNNFSSYSFVVNITGISIRSLSGTVTDTNTGNTITNTSATTSTVTFSGLLPNTGFNTITIIVTYTNGNTETITYDNTVYTMPTQPIITGNLYALLNTTVGSPFTVTGIYDKYYIIIYTDTPPAPPTETDSIFYTNSFNIPTSQSGTIKFRAIPYDKQTNTYTYSYASSYFLLTVITPVLTVSKIDYDNNYSYNYGKYQFRFTIIVDSTIVKSFTVDFINDDNTITSAPIYSTIYTLMSIIEVVNLKRNTKYNPKITITYTGDMTSTIMPGIMYTLPTTPVITGNLNALINNTAGSTSSFIFDGSFDYVKVYTSTTSISTGFTTSDISYTTAFTLPITASGTTYFYVVPYDNRSKFYNTDYKSLTTTFIVYLPNASSYSSVSNFSSNSFVVNIAGVSIQSLSGTIIKNGTSVTIASTSATTSSVTFSGLLSNIGYNTITITVTYINGVTATITPGITVYTKPSIPTITGNNFVPVNSVAGSTSPFTIGGTFNNVKLYKSTTSISTGFTTDNTLYTTAFTVPITSIGTVYFYIVPYDIQTSSYDVNYKSLTTIFTITSGSVFYSSVSDFTSNSFYVNITGTNIQSLRGTITLDGTTATIASTSATTTSIIFSGLLPNTGYNTIIITVTYINGVTDTLILGITVYTKPTIPIITGSIVSNINTIAGSTSPFTFSGIYDNVIAYKSTTSISTGFTTDNTLYTTAFTLQITTLGTTYFYIVPYNKQTNSYDTSYKSLTTTFDVSYINTSSYLSVNNFATDSFYVNINGTNIQSLSGTIIKDGTTATIANTISRISSIYTVSMTSSVIFSGLLTNTGYKTITITVTYINGVTAIITPGITVYTLPNIPIITGSFVSNVNTITGSTSPFAISGTYDNVKVYKSTTSISTGFTTDNILYTTAFTLPITIAGTTYFYIVPYNKQSSSYDIANKSDTQSFKVNNYFLVTNINNTINSLTFTLTGTNIQSFRATTVEYGTTTPTFISTAETTTSFTFKGLTGNTQYSPVTITCTYTDGTVSTSYDYAYTAVIKATITGNSTAIVNTTPGSTSSFIFAGTYKTVIVYTSTDNINFTTDNIPYVNTYTLPITSSSTKYFYIVPFAVQSNDYNINYKSETFTFTVGYGTSYSSVTNFSIYSFVVNISGTNIKSLSGTVLKYGTTTQIASTSATTASVTFGGLTENTGYNTIRILVTYQNGLTETIIPGITVYTKPNTPSIIGENSVLLSNVAGSTSPFIINGMYDNVKVYKSTSSISSGFTTDDTLYTTDFSLPITSEGTIYFYAVPYDKQTNSYDVNNKSLTITFIVSNNTAAFQGVGNINSNSFIVYIYGINIQSLTGTVIRTGISGTTTYTSATTTTVTFGQLNSNSEYSNITITVRYFNGDTTTLTPVYTLRTLSNATFTVVNVTFPNTYMISINLTNIYNCSSITGKVSSSVSSATTINNNGTITFLTDILSEQSYTYTITATSNTDSGTYIVSGVLYTKPSNVTAIVTPGVNSCQIMLNNNYGKYKLLISGDINNIVTQVYATDMNCLNEFYSNNTYTFSGLTENTNYTWHIYLYNMNSGIFEYYSNMISYNQISYDTGTITFKTNSLSTTPPVSPITILNGTINTDYTYTTITPKIINGVTYTKMYAFSNFYKNISIKSNTSSNAYVFIVGGGGQGGYSSTDRSFTLDSGSSGGGGGGIAMGSYSFNTNNTFNIKIGSIFTNTYSSFERVLSDGISTNIIAKATNGKTVTNTNDQFPNVDDYRSDGGNSGTYTNSRDYLSFDYLDNFIGYGNKTGGIHAFDGGNLLIVWQATPYDKLLNEIRSFFGLNVPPDIITKYKSGGGGGGAGAYKNGTDGQKSRTDSANHFISGGDGGYGGNGFLWDVTGITYASGGGGGGGTISIGNAGNGLGGLGGLGGGSGGSMGYYDASITYGSGGGGTNGKTGTHSNARSGIVYLLFP